MTTSGIKVMSVYARLNVGGPSRQAILLHQRLPPLGYRSFVVFGSVAPDEASLEHLLEGPGIVKLPDLGARVRLLSDARGFAQLTRLFFREQPDVVHTHTAKAGTLGRLAAATYNMSRPRRRRCLVVHTFHGNVLQGYFGPTASRAIRLVERSLSAITDVIIAISPRQRAEIVDRFRVAPAGRVQTLPLGLDLDRFFEIGAVDKALRRELGFPDEAILFGALGRLVSIKNIALLLRAFAGARRGDAAVRLVIAGDGPERTTLQRLSEELGVAESVRFVGWRQDLQRVYAGLDVVALSSRNEGTPVALIEAMAAGRPVVATAVGGVPDLLAEGAAGLLVPPDDPARFAEAMLLLASSPDERLRLGGAGRDLARQYRADRLVAGICRIFEEGLHRRRGVPAGDVAPSRRS